MWVTRQYEGKRKNGDVLLVYLIFYPLVRFSLDFIRLDASLVGSININQTVMGIIALIALGTLIWRHRPGSGDDNLAPLTPEFGFISKSEESDEEPIEAEPILEAITAEEPLVVKKAPVKRAPSRKSIDKVDTAPVKTPRKTAKPAAQPARKPAAKKPPKATE
jgi:hypothetical protein